MNGSSRVAELHVAEDGMIVFHLAFIMSGQCEQDFDLGFQVNFMGTKNLMDACRARKDCKFIFPSSGACFGERDGGPETDGTKLLPYTTYGMTKAMCELLLNDYSRRGLLDGRAARLPTVIPRLEVSSEIPAAFSEVLRDPLKGQDVTLPVGPDVPHAVCGFRCVVRNLLHLADLPSAAFSDSIDRALNMPALRVTLNELEAAMRTVVRDPSKLGKVFYNVDEELCTRLKTFHNDMDASRAARLGFFADPSPAAIAADFAAEYLSEALLKPVLEMGEEPRHNLVFANSYAKVFRAEVVPGDQTLWHIHRTDSVFFVFARSRLKNEIEGRGIIDDTMVPGEVRYANYSTTPCTHRACVLAEPGARGFCAVVVELPPRLSADGDASGEPPQVEGLVLVKDLPRVRVWQCEVPALESRNIALPFRCYLWIVEAGGKVDGSLGRRLLLPAEFGFVKDGGSHFSITVFRSVS